MRSGFEERRERGIGRIQIHQRCPQNSKSLPAGSNSSKRGLNVRGMFTTSDRARE
jgi:hypothetical protein